MAEVEIVQAAPVPVFVADYTPIIEITISARAGTDCGSLTVMDNGPGVPPQQRDKIFNAYERGEAPSGLAPSLGLGLHISRFLAERMGGDLTYRYDDQSIFEFRLPLAPPNAG
jgi:signal transduction histidine kinase